MKPDLSKSLFWDIDISTLDAGKHARFIIERVLMRGNLKDWQELKAFYGLQKIREEALQIRFLDKKTLNFCHVLFNIKKEEFRCYNTEQSIRQLWNF
jgi:hypothetical protein